MTSIDRKEARYQRRVAARQEKKDNLANKYTFDKVFSYANLYAAYKECRKGVAWKASTQKCISEAPLIIAKLHRELMSGKFKSKGFYEFDIFERGKERHIRSVTIEERIVQRCLCDNALVPLLSRTFIYDNGASLKNKGYTFSQNRCAKHLRDHYNKYGNEGYVLVFDFSKFFDNISHRVAKEILRENIADSRILKLTEYFINVFGDVGLGLGSQVSQIMALASANRLDHYIKEILQIHGYGRYMDDGYLIHPSKEYLQECLEKIKVICDELEIKLNIKKTHIVKITHGFTFLKAKYYLLDNGKIIKKLARVSITRMRRKLKKFKPKVDAGIMIPQDVYQSWQSWRAYASNFNSYITVRNMKRLYNDLYGEPKVENDNSKEDEYG